MIPMIVPKCVEKKCVRVYLSASEHINAKGFSCIFVLIKVCLLVIGYVYLQAPR